MTQNNSIDNVEVKRSYYESGALRCEAPQVNGNMHGIIKEYYPSGALWVETPFVDGYMHGIARHYFESGALGREVPYVNGKKHGIEKKYNSEKSNIISLTLYDRSLYALDLCLESYKGSSI